MLYSFMTADENRIHIFLSAGENEYYCTRYSFLVNLGHGISHAVGSHEGSTDLTYYPSIGNTFFYIQTVAPAEWATCICTDLDRRVKAESSTRRCTDPSAEKPTFFPRFQPEGPRLENSSDLSLAVVERKACAFYGWRWRQCWNSHQARLKRLGWKKKSVPLPWPFRHPNKLSHFRY